MEPQELSRKLAEPTRTCPKPVRHTQHSAVTTAGMVCVNTYVSVDVFVGLRVFLRMGCVILACATLEEAGMCRGWAEWQACGKADAELVISGAGMMGPLRKSCKLAGSPTLVANWALCYACILARAILIFVGPFQSGARI
jgi:hypothetical protein